MKGLEDSWAHFIKQKTTDEAKEQGWKYKDRLSKVSQVLTAPTGEEIDYYRYVRILKTYYQQVSQHLIMGHQFNFKSGLGHLKARRVERDFSKPQVNTIATIRNHRAGIHKKVYRIEEDWSRIAYCRPAREYMQKYKFVISRTSGNTKGNSSNEGLKNRFIRALDENPWLKYQYDYYPNN